MKIKRIVLLSMILLLLVSIGCKTGSNNLVSNEYDVLMTSKAVYDAAFKSLAVLDKEGKLPTKVKKEAIKFGNIYMNAHNMAVQAILDNKKPNVESVLAALDVFLNSIIEYYKP